MFHILLSILKCYQKCKTGIAFKWLRGPTRITNVLQNNLKRKNFIPLFVQESNIFHTSGTSLGGSPLLYSQVTQASRFHKLKGVKGSRTQAEGRLTFGSLSVWASLVENEDNGSDDDDDEHSDDAADDSSDAAR